MNKKERLILIERYRKGLLEGIELKRFEKLLETDPLLRDELNLDIEMSEALNEGSDYNLFHKLVQEAEQNYFRNQGTSVTSMPWLKIAATVLLISVSSFLIWQQMNQNDTPDDIFKSAFEPYEAPTNFRGEDLSGMDEEFMLGLLKYNDLNYSESIRLFSEAVVKDSSNHTAKFLLGVSHMALKEFRLAEPIFKEMIDDSSHLFQDQVRWYLGLLYLSDGDTGNDSMTNDTWNQITDKDYLKKARKRLH